MRDKLIELLSENFVDFCNVDIIAGHAKIRAITFRADDFADYLLAHGVTLAEDNNVLGKKPITNGDRIRAMADEELATDHHLITVHSWGVLITAMLRCTAMLG